MNKTVRDQLALVMLSIVSLLVVMAIMNFKWKDMLPDVIVILISIALIIFRKPYARACVNSQNKTWGTHYGEDEILRTAQGTVYISLIVIAWCVMSLCNISFNVAISESKENVLAGISFIAIGLLFVFYRDKDKKAIIHIDGKPAMVRIGGKQLYLHHVLQVVFGLFGIAAGISMLLDRLS